MNDALSTVQAGYACFGRGDVPALLDLLADDVRWQFRGDRRVPYTGSFRGRGQVGEWFGMVAAHDAIQSFEPLEFLAGDGHVTVIGRERTQALPGGRVFDSEWVHVWRVEGGLVKSFWGMLDTEAAAAARP